MKKIKLLLAFLFISLIFISCSRQEPLLPVAPPVTLLDLKFNEIFSQGSPDWIEIYNPNNVEVDISGYKVYDDGVTNKISPFPSGTKIAANGFIVVLCDDGASGEGYHGNFKLSSSGERVSFEDKNGKIIDTCTFPALTASQSYARIPDGTGGWVKTATPTKGTANIGTASTLPIVMNEIFSQGSPDWIELYNPNESEIDISGYIMYDGGVAEADRKSPFASGTKIASKGFVVVLCDDGASGAGYHGNFKLSSSGEKVWLALPTKAVIDSVAFPALSTTQSYGRLPDGSVNWQILATPTQGAANRNN